MKMRTVQVRKCLPAVITCDPHEEFPLEPKHTFEVAKVYLMTDTDGSESGIVICPVHQLPISRRILHQTTTS